MRSLHASVLQRGLQGQGQAPGCRFVENLCLDDNDNIMELRSSSDIAFLACRLTKNESRGGPAPMYATFARSFL